MANKKVTFTKEQKDHLINLFTDLRKMNQTMLSELTERVENADGFNAEDNEQLQQEEAIDSTFTLVMDKHQETLREETRTYGSLCVRFRVAMFKVQSEPTRSPWMSLTWTTSPKTHSDEIQARWETLKKSHPINVL
jgi:hypothetical protein